VRAVSRTRASVPNLEYDRPVEGPILSARGSRGGPNPGLVRPRNSPLTSHSLGVLIETTSFRSSVGVCPAAPGLLARKETFSLGDTLPSSTVGARDRSCAAGRHLEKTRQSRTLLKQHARSQLLLNQQGRTVAKTPRSNSSHARRRSQ